MAYQLRIGLLLRRHLVVCFWLALFLISVTFGFVTLLSSELQIRRGAEASSAVVQKK